MRSEKFRYEGGVNEVCISTGAVVSDTHPGVNVEIHWRDGEDLPCSAEVYSDDQEMYAELGFEWENGKLEGYDGVADLPDEVLRALVSLGYDVSPITETNAEYERRFGKG